MLPTLDMPTVSIAKVLSPLRKTTASTSVESLAREQLEHFGIEPESEYGQALLEAVIHIYHAQSDITRLWEITTDTIETLPKEDKVARFNAKRFLSFQLAKVLDTLQNPLRKTYQSLNYREVSTQAKGPYPLFDNVTALFSANPVIVRTATYLYACTEWVDDAFQGKEPLHEIYSRLLNPTSISLANYIVDIEAGPLASQYLAWNFNSGMAAIDALLSSVLQREDIIIVSRNVYGGTYQLLHDYFARPGKLNVRIVWFDGYTLEDFQPVFDRIYQTHRSALESGRQRLHLYIESPCNPHGYLLDFPKICRYAKQHGVNVMLDGTVGTPFLNKPLQHPDEQCRPDYLVHSYTKDITGNGNATAGVVIGRNELMFLPKGEQVGDHHWSDSLFWNVYYIKGAFLDADKAFEVISGIKTLNLRMIQKCINTIVLARFFQSHPQFNVHCNALEENDNHTIMRANTVYGLPAPLFTIDMEDAGISAATFKRFFDCLSPAFNFQVSLGQSNTTILCPALTSHSELDATALRESGIYLTTMRISVGNENPKELIEHFLHAAELMIDKVYPGFSAQFMSLEALDGLYKATYLQVHRSLVEQNYLG